MLAQPATVGVPAGRAIESPRRRSRVGTGNVAHSHASAAARTCPTSRDGPESYRGRQDSHQERRTSQGQGVGDSIDAIQSSVTVVCAAGGEELGPRRKAAATT